MIDLKKIKAVFFDLDGTLVNSSPLHEKAYLHALSQSTNDTSESFDYSDFAGKSSMRSFIDLGFEDEEALKLTEIKQEKYRQFIDEGLVHPIQDMIEALLALKKNKKEIFIVTGASREAAEKTIKTLKIDNVVSGILTGDDIDCSKPDPGFYMSALDAFGYSEEEVIVVEDALSGIYSAIGAKLKTVSIKAECDDPLCKNMEPKDFLKLVRS